MTSTDQLREIIREAFQKETFPYVPFELYEPIRYTISQGGKRLRPLLVLLGCDLFGGDLNKALSPAIAMEIFHNFTLLHDDIMDQAPIRRGKETVYKKWNPNIAILSGDTMLVLAYDYLSKSDAALLPELFSLFNRTGRQVCEGQQYDMNFESQETVSESDYLEMIRLKTAVLLGCSVQTGAILAHAPREEAEKIYRFGENLGLAFQLQDDLLDSFGDPEKFGKEIGGDILCNKKTFLYIKAFELAGPAELKVLNHYFSSQKHDPQEKIREITAIYWKLNVQEYSNDLISLYFDKALECIGKIDAEHTSKSELKLFANNLLRRDH